MRTAVALFCLAAVALLAVAASLQFFGLLHGELTPVVGDDVLQVVGVRSPYDHADDAAPVADAPFPPDPETLVTDDPVAPSTDVPQAGATAADAPVAAVPASSGGAVRIIGGPGIGPGPAPGGALEREAVPPAPHEAARWRRFPRVVIVEPGLLDAGKRKLRLAGIVAPEPDQSCRRAAGTPELSCTQLSVQALRQRVRALGVECQVSVDDPSDPVVAPCRIGKTDLSLWLIEQGWAHAAADAPDAYQDAAAKARCSRAGLWRATEPPQDCPAP